MNYPWMEGEGGRERGRGFRGWRQEDAERCRDGKYSGEVAKRGEKTEKGLV